MNIQELATIADYGIPVVICIFDNRTLGMVYQWQNLFYGGRQCNVTFGESPDFVKVAKGYGIEAQRVTDPKDIKEVLREALLSDEPYLIDFVIDPSEGLPMVPPGGKLKNIIEPVRALPRERIPSFQEIKRKLLGETREKGLSKDGPQEMGTPVERETY